MITDKNICGVSLILSVLSCGNGYLPINNEWPAERVKFILRQTRMQACIVQKRYCNELESILAEENLRSERMDIDEDNFLFKIGHNPLKYPKDLAYILFTSGSTGFPKGVIHTAGSLNAFIKWTIKEFGKHKLKRFVSIAPFNFDLSLFDIFFPLCNGGRLFLPEASALSNPRQMAVYLVKHKIEVIYTTPSYLKLLIATGQLQKFKFDFIKLILIAGEQLDYKLSEDLKKYFKKATLYNLYGPTETNVCTYHKINLKTGQKGNVPIGRACYPKEIKLSKENELIYKGRLLMKGFINENGIHKTTGWYKTGDLVKKLPSGDFEFIGRKDKMIKRNGFRIEPEEIKNALLKLRGITLCEVLVIKKENWKIIAFVQDNEKLGELQLKNFCLQNLPAYMLPDRIICMQEMPLNLNHKADLNRLREMIS